MNSQMAGESQVNWGTISNLFIRTQPIEPYVENLSLGPFLIAKGLRYRTDIRLLS